MLNPALVNAWISDRPEEFLYELYGDQLRRDGYNRWRVETPHALTFELKYGAPCFYEHATGQSGDAIELWTRERKCDSATAMNECAHWLGISDYDKPGSTCLRDEFLRAEMIPKFHDILGSLRWDNDSKNHGKVHQAFICAARLGIPSERALPAIVMRIREAGGILDGADLQRQMKRAYEYVGRAAAGDIGALEKEPQLEFSPQALRVVTERIDIADPVETLKNKSQVEPSTVTPAGYLEFLFRPGERVIVFNNQKDQGVAAYCVGQKPPVTFPDHGADGIKFLIQPVDGEDHWNPREGRNSRRSEESITCFRYLLLESDDAEEGDWIRLLLQLPLPIVSICRSAGKSVHAIVRVDASDKGEWDAIKDRIAKRLVPLGADPCALRAVQLSRLPQCWRGEKLQELLYLNQNPDGTPIYKGANAEGCQ